jgi:hypothetical protein
MEAAVRPGPAEEEEMRRTILIVLVATTLTTPAWSWLTALWDTADKGASLDPNGATVNDDKGASLDPDG